MVVPMFAPNITPTDCVRFIRPALTKPTAITVVADELCIIIVKSAPTSKPRYLFLVNALSIFLRPEPAAFSDWSSSCSYRKGTTPIRQKAPNNFQIPFISPTKKQIDKKNMSVVSNMPTLCHKNKLFAIILYKKVTLLFTQGFYYANSAKFLLAPSLQNPTASALHIAQSRLNLKGLAIGNRFSWVSATPCR